MEYQPDSNLLADRIVLITGASDGIGREAAITYARYGAQVVLLGRNGEKLQQVCEQINKLQANSARWFVLDLETATADSCRQLAEDIAGQLPRLDGVLHNAGLLGEVVTMDKQPPDLWQQVMQVNVNSTFFLTQALLPLLLKSDSASLILTSSSVGSQGRAGWGAYSVSKFATEGMMQVLADEYDPAKLRVNCIDPGGTRTKMRASAFPQEEPLTLKTPADIMPLYLWLMGKDSAGKSGLCYKAQPDRP